MKNLFPTVLIGICVLLSGCRNNRSVSDSVVLDTPDISSGASSSSDPDLYLEKFIFRSRLFIRDPDKDTLKKYFETPTDGKLRLSVNAQIEPDESMADIPAEIRVYVFGDGRPLNFRIENSSDNSAPSAVRKIIPDDLSDISFDMEVELDTDSDIDIITVIWNMYPNYIPKKGLGALSSCIVYSMQNISCSYDAVSTKTDEGYFMIRSDENKLDIGTADLTSSDKIVEDHFYDDVTVTPQNKDLFVKFNSGKESDSSYYLILFRDGKLLEAFDGGYSAIIDCKSGERTFQFKIPEEFIPDSGLHTFQAAAIPVYAYSQNSERSRYEAICTTKIRVIIQAE